MYVNAIQGLTALKINVPKLPVAVEANASAAMRYGDFFDGRSYCVAVK